MAQFLGEISWDSILLTLPTPSAATGGQWVGIAFSVAFTDFGGTPRGAQLQLTMQGHSFGGGPTYEWQTLQQEFAGGAVSGVFFDYTLSLGFSTLEANGQNGAAFRSPPGGAIRLTILIDDVAQTVTFTGPLGSHTHSFLSLGYAAGIVSNVKVLDLGGSMNVEDPADSFGMTVGFYALYLSFNGERTAGAQLGTLQPGSFLVNPWVNEGGGLDPITVTDGRTETRLILGLNYTGGASVVAVVNGAHAAYGTGLADVELLLHMLRLPDEGTLLYARVIKQHVDAVEVGVSDDNGHTWNPVLAGKADGRFYNSPSLCTSPDGTVNLFVMDRSVKFTRWFKSYDWGRSWLDAGALLPLLPWSTFTHPKVFTLFNGFFLLSYNTANHHFVQVFDGATASIGISPATDFGANGGGFDTYPALWQSEIGTVYSADSTSALGTEREQLSSDFGVDWDQLYSASLNTRQVVMVRNNGSAFLWKEFQDGSGNMLVQGSADAGLTALSVPIIVTGSPFAQQYSGLEVLPLGGVIVIPQRYNAGTDHWQIEPYVSNDFGQTWSPA